jgi:hypothetical protein
MVLAIPYFCRDVELEICKAWDGDDPVSMGCMQGRGEMWEDLLVAVKCIVDVCLRWIDVPV